VTPSFLDILCRRLRRRGVSRRYVRRLACELGDHYESLVALHLRGGHEESQARQLAEQQIGDPDALFAEVLGRRTLGRPVRRHPFVVFALSPVPLAVAMASLCALVFACGYVLCVRVAHVSPLNPALRFVFHYGFYALAYGLTPLLALAYCRLAARHGCPVWMAGVASLLLCAAGGFLVVHFVQCKVSGSAKYFQWWGVDALRLSLPLAVFALHAAQRLVRERTVRRVLLG
jgi:hypothetical protein